MEETNGTPETKAERSVSFSDDVKWSEDNDEIVTASKDATRIDGVPGSKERSLQMLQVQ